MKNLLFLLSISLALSSCTRDEPVNYFAYGWHNSRYTHHCANIKNIMNDSVYPNDMKNFSSYL